MDFSIGGEFEINIDLLLHEKNKIIFNEYDSVVDTDTGRSALLLALKCCLEKGINREAWLPRFVCQSVLLPFEQLNFKIHFYSVGADLQQLKGLPDNLYGVVILYIHYFGKKNNRVIQWLRDNKMMNNNFIIEDCVQASLNSNVGFDGQFAIRSFRKFLPQPDGAMLTCKEQVDCELLESDESFISQKLIGKLLRTEKIYEEEFLRLFALSEATIDSQIIPRKRSWLSGYLYQKSNIKEVGSIRRENWLMVQKLLIDFNLEEVYIKSLYEGLENAEIPLGYPVVVKNDLRNSLRNFLMEKKIFCPVHWIIKDLDSPFEVEMTLSNSILTFPIDQRMQPNMVLYMVKEILNFYKKS